MTARKTYWHLEALGRKPTDYDVATSRLLPYTERGFEVWTPITPWYERYQRGSPLVARDWDRFRDPRETTYASYTKMQRAKEAFVDGLLRSVDETGYDRRLSPSWLPTLDAVLPTLRFPIHALQMTAAYVGHMAPSGRLVVALLFQAADEMRRVQRIAYRMRQLQETHPGFGGDSRSTWQRDPRWQPLRQVVEKLLVTYDWGEALVALNLVMKPMFDDLFMSHLARIAERAGDDTLGKMLFSLEEDCRWQREWSAAFIRLVLEDGSENRSVIRAWIDAWHGPVAAALEPIESMLAATQPDADPSSRPTRDPTTAFWRSLGLEEGTAS